MKRIVNVYKDAGLWHKPPPGIGDYLRGCAYLVYASRTGPFAGLFQPGVNLDLAPGSASLTRSPLYMAADRADLIAAPEHFYTPRDGDVRQLIEAFLHSDASVLHISTNHSWRGIDDEPPAEVLDAVAPILAPTPEFLARVQARHTAFGDYVLIHIRDADRSADAEPGPDEIAYRARAERFVERVMSNLPGVRLVCMSNNERLRDHLCGVYTLINAETEVQNPGFAGVLSDAELMDVALMGGCRRLYSLSYFGWSSGFSVWVSRLFRIPALILNAGSEV